LSDLKEKLGMLKTVRERKAEAQKRLDFNAEREAALVAEIKAERAALEDALKEADDASS